MLAHKTNAYMSSQTRTGEFRLLVVPSWYPPNGGSFFREQAEFLAGTNFSVTVVAPVACFPRKSLRRWLVAGIRLTLRQLCKPSVEGRGRLTHHFVPYPALPTTQFWAPLHGLIFRRAFRAGFRSVTCQQSFDGALVLSMIPAARSALWLHRKTSIPVAIAEHRGRFLDSPQVPQKLARSISSRLVKRVQSIATAYFVVSPAMLKSSRLQLHRASSRAVVLPNPIDVEAFRPRMRQSLGEQPRFVFASVGSLVQHKGFDLVLSAFALAFQDDVPTLLRIAGTGPLLDSLVSQAQNLGIASRVEFVGQVSRSRMPRFLNSCDAFVSGSRVESFGVAIAEALSCGLPVAATRTGGAEFLVPARVGLLSPVDDAAQLAESMRRLRSRNFQVDPVQSHMHVRQNFGPQQFSQTILSGFVSN